MKITSKTQFYELWQAGRLGNRPAAWPTLGDLRHSGFRGLVTIRYKGRAGGGVSTTHVPASEVGAAVERFVSDGADPQLLTFHESMPDRQLLIQGEVVRSVGGLDLTYSLQPNISMREAMRSPRTSSGLTAKLILEQYLDPNSQDDLGILLTTYPDAVVEFGSYSVEVGIFPRRNTIFWEVRNY